MKTTSDRDTVPRDRRAEIIREARELAVESGFGEQIHLNAFMVGALAERVAQAEARLAQPRGELSPDEVGILRGFDEERQT